MNEKFREFAGSKLSTQTHTRKEVEEFAEQYRKLGPINVNEEKSVAMYEQEGDADSTTYRFIRVINR
jgi:hypothetical protein